MTLRGGYVGYAGKHLIKKVKQLIDLLGAAGDLFVERGLEIFNAAGHGDIHGLAVGANGQHAEAVGYLVPVYLDSVGVEDVTNVAGIFGRAEVAQLVQ